MKRKITIWASIGFFVACGWAVYAYLIPMTPADHGTWIFANLTFPITLMHHYRISLYTALFANVITYALVGLIVETVRRQMSHEK